MDAEREALQSAACPQVQTFCQKHGLTFEVVDLRWGIQNSEATDHMTTEICLEELDRCRKTSIGPAFVALIGDQYGPCPVPSVIEEKEWEALRAQLSARPRDLELVARRFRRDENSVPPTYVLQATGGREAPGPEEATLTSVLRSGAQEAWRRGLISQEQWHRHHRSVIEWEMERGLLGSAAGERGATVFLREIQDLSKHILEDCALKMVDRLADGCLDTDAQNLLRDLKGRVADAHPGVLKTHRLPWSRDLVNPKNKAHARYLQELGEQFVARADHQVLEHLRELQLAGRDLAWLYQEIRHHLWQGVQKDACVRTDCVRTLSCRDVLAIVTAEHGALASEAGSLRQAASMAGLCPRTHLLSPLKDGPASNSVDQLAFIPRQRGGGKVGPWSQRLRCGVRWLCGSGPEVRQSIVAEGCSGDHEAETEERHGLSEAELKDVLSLDDEVLQVVYRDWTPPSKELLRFPPLLQLAEVVWERYLSGPEEAERHRVLADFFSGAWSQGTKKLITLPLVGKPLNLDRKVAPQPLWFSDTVANQRKLKELPHHLLHSGRLEELKQEVLGEVRCVKVFAEGILAISASRDHTLRVWNLLSGQEKFTIWDGGSKNSTESQIWNLHVDETNKIMYSTSGSKINAWSLETAELVFRIPGDGADPWVSTAVLASQTRLLAVSRGGEVTLWNSATGSLQGKHRLSSIKEETPTCAVSVQTQGKVVTGFSDGSISLVSPGGDRLLEKLPEAVGFLVVSEDESLLAAGFGRSVRIFLADSQGFHRFMASDLEHEDVVETAVFGAENNLIVTGSRDALIQVWSLSEQGTLLDVLEGVGAPVSLLVRGGALVASASQQSSSFKVWDLTCTQRPRASAPFLDRTGLTAVSHNGSYVYFPKIGDKNKVTIWDVAEGEEQDSLDTSNEVKCLEVAEQAQLLFTGLVSGIVLVFPLNSRQDVMCIPPPEARKAINCMSLSKNEDRLAIAYDNIVLVLDISPGDPCPVIDGPTYTFYTQLPETIACVTVLTDYRVVYGMTNGDLFLYECANSKVFPLEAHRSRVTCVEVSHQEQLAVSGSEEALLCLWELEACKWKFKMSYTSSFCRGVQCACFSKDDKFVYVGLKDRSIVVWSVLDGTLLAVQFVHAVVNRIIPTSNGFIAPTRHGYLIRERFHCPSSRASQEDPLKNFKKAVWMVKSRQREELAAAAETPQDLTSKMAQGNKSRSNKHSQVCLLV
ncbi:NACHT and WD repeat domain containing 1 [Ictidomys tridecemlineatus]|nr:NACHT and WD repeat domain containing 1 [Ictidomys tridecemlineatus]